MAVQASRDLSAIGTVAEGLQQNEFSFEWSAQEIVTVMAGSPEYSTFTCPQKQPPVGILRDVVELFWKDYIEMVIECLECLKYVQQHGQHSAGARLFIPLATIITTSNQPLFSLPRDVKALVVSGVVG